MAIKEKIPVVDSIVAFAPTQRSVDSEVLQYEKLEPMVEQNIPFESTRWSNFLEEKDTLNEAVAARKLVEHYFTRKT